MDIVDQAQAAEQRERFRGVARIRAGLLAEGTDNCVDCDEAIPPDRKNAMPNARRCACCQEKLEFRGRR